MDAVIRDTGHVFGSGGDDPVLQLCREGVIRDIAAIRLRGQSGIQL